MKLDDCVTTALACGLTTYGEALDNISFHATQLFEYSRIGAEMQELVDEFQNSNLTRDTILPRHPVHKQGDFWYFWDETWTELHGPFESQEEACAGLREYCDLYL